MSRQSELGEGASDKIHTHNKTHHDHTVKIIGGSGTHVQTGRKTELDGRREQNQQKLAGRQQCVHTQQNQGPAETKDKNIAHAQPLQLGEGGNSKPTHHDWDK